MPRSHQPPAELLAAEVDESHAGMRLDRFLSAALPQLSRTRVQALIKCGQVASRGATIEDAKYRVKPGERFELAVPPAAETTLAAEAIPLDVVYEDDALIVIDKPAGLVVHPGAGQPAGTLVNALIAHCGKSLSGIGGVARPGIVHRLDKDTSGLMVVAKTDQAHRALAEQFADHGRTGETGARLPRSGVGRAVEAARPHRGAPRTSSHEPHQDGGLAGGEGAARGDLLARG